MTQISMYPDAFDPIGKDVSLKTILAAIQNGRWMDSVQLLRTMKKAEYDIKKRDLPCVTFSGTFFNRSDSLLDIYSGMIIIDIDKLSSLEEVNKVFNFMCSDEHVYACWISPSNKGLKALVKVDSDYTLHKAAFIQLEHYFRDRYNIVIDKTGKNISRLCFIGWDPNLYLQEEATVFKVLLPLPRENKPKLEDRGGPIVTDQQQIMDICAEWVGRKSLYIEGNRHMHLYKLACLLNRAGIDEGSAVNYIDSKFDTPNRRWEQAVKSAYKHKGEFGSIKVRTKSSKLTNAEIALKQPYNPQSPFEDKYIEMALYLFGKSLPVDVVDDIMLAKYHQWTHSDLLINSCDEKDIQNHFNEHRALLTKSIHICIAKKNKNGNNEQE